MSMDFIHQALTISEINNRLITGETMRIKPSLKGRSIVERVSSAIRASTHPDNESTRDVFQFTYTAIGTNPFSPYAVY